jgi:hypothetical protein
MVKELTLAAAESRFMGQFSPIYQATGLFNCFQVKSWVLVSWLKNYARKPLKKRIYLVKPIYSVCCRTI